MQKSKYLIITFCFAVFILGYHNTLLTLFDRWTQFDESQSHGLIIIGLFVWTYYQRLQPLTITGKPGLIGLSGVLLFSILWSVSYAISIDIIEQFSLLAILFFLQIALFGMRQSLTIIPTILFLLFAIPFWDYFNPFLIELSSVVVTFFLEKVDMVAHIDGNSIFFPFGTVVIADGCSGLRYLVISLSLAYYLILTSQLSVYKSLFILFISATLGLIVNWLRIFIIVIIAYESEMQSSLVNDHETFGWFLFIIVILPLFYYARKLPIYSVQPEAGKGDSKQCKILPLIILVLLSGPALLFINSKQLNPPDIVNKFSNIQLDGFVQKNAEDIHSDKLPTKMEIVHQNKTIEDTKLVTKLYWQAKAGDSLVPYLNGLYDKNFWSASYSSPETFHGIEGKGFILKNKASGYTKAQVDVFMIFDRTTGKYSLAKLLQIPALLLKQNYFIHVSAEAGCKDADCRNELELIKNSSAEMIDTIRKQL